MKKIVFVLSLLASACLFAQDDDARIQLQELIDDRQMRIEHFALYPQQLADAARSLENPNVIYDPSYVKLSYPLDKRKIGSINSFYNYE